MKQPTLNDIITALNDHPRSVRERLAILGVEDADLAGKFAPEVLDMVIYGSSFLKFLQDNSKRLGVDAAVPTEALPEDYKNGFAEEGEKVLARLVNLGLDEEEAKELFDADTLNLTLSGKEFQDLLVKNQVPLLDKLSLMADKEVPNG